MEDVWDTSGGPIAGGEEEGARPAARRRAASQANWGERGAREGRGGHDGEAEEAGWQGQMVD
eukprot:1101653-Heterocapsa_arctica.AAC.1